MGTGFWLFMVVMFWGWLVVFLWYIGEENLIYWDIIYNRILYYMVGYKDKYGNLVIL